jgi:hypothetical protein
MYLKPDLTNHRTLTGKSDCCSLENAQNNSRNLEKFIFSMSSSDNTSRRGKYSHNSKHNRERVNSREKKI